MKKKPASALALQVSILSSGETSPLALVDLFSCGNVIPKLLFNSVLNCLSSVSSSVLNCLSSVSSNFLNSLSSVSSSVLSLLSSSLSAFNSSLNSLLSYVCAVTSLNCSTVSNSLNSSAVSSNLTVSRLVVLLLVTRNKSHGCNSSNHQYQLFHFF